jgi:cyanophycin synthetase
MTIDKDNYASYKLLERALAPRGFTLTVDTTAPATATYTAPSGVAWVTHAAHIAYPFTSDAVRDMSINKTKAYEFAAAKDFAVPYTRQLDGEISEGEAKELFAAYGRLVVKPADSSLSRGLTVDITSYDQLMDAITHARAVSPRVLVQEQVAGEELRFTVIDGRAEAVLLRRTPRVTGDGRHTVAELIAAENALRRQIHLEYVSYPQLDGAIISPDFLTSTRVPAAGETVELSRSTMISGGCSVLNVTDTVDESYKKAVESLVADLDAGFMVVDVFCRDYTAPIRAGNYRLIEFNTAPALKLYYGCRDGKQFDIVPRLAAMIDTYLQR